MKKITSLTSGLEQIELGVRLMMKRRFDGESLLTKWNRNPSPVVQHVLILEEERKLMISALSDKNDWAKLT